MQHLGWAIAALILLAGIYVSLVGQPAVVVTDRQRLTQIADLSTVAAFYQTSATRAESTKTAVCIRYHDYCP